MNEVEYIEVDGVLIEKDDILSAYDGMEFVPISVLLENPDLLLTKPNRCNWKEFSDMIIEFFPQFVHVEYVNWERYSDIILEHRKDLVEQHPDMFNWVDQSCKIAEKCSEEFVDKHIDLYNFNDFSYSLQRFQPKLAEKYKDRLKSFPDHL